MLILSSFFATSYCQHIPQQAFFAGYLFVFPVVGAIYLGLWVGFLCLGSIALKKLGQQYANGEGALPAIAFLLAFGFPVFGVLLVYNSSGRFLDKSARELEEQLGQSSSGGNNRNSVGLVHVQTALERNVRRFGLFGFLLQMFLIVAANLITFGAYFWSGSFRCRKCAVVSAWNCVVLIFDLGVFVVCLHRKNHLPSRGIPSIFLLSVFPNLIMKY